MTTQREPSLESLIAGDGWAGLENLEQRLGARRQESESEQMRLALVVEHVFRDEEGRQVLEHLLDVTLRRSALPETVAAQHPVSFEQIGPYVTFREGQNALMLHILRLLRLARQSREKRSER